jgi:hypothetical protein
VLAATATAAWGIGIAATLLLGLVHHQQQVFRNFLVTLQICCFPISLLLLLLYMQVLPPVEALLDVTAHPEHDIFSMSFGFWHKVSRQLSVASLQQEQQQQQQTPGSPIQPAAAAATSAAAAEQQRRREFFRPAFEKLISLVRARMRWVAGSAAAAAFLRAGLLW